MTEAQPGRRLPAAAPPVSRVAPPDQHRAPGALREVAAAEQHHALGGFRGVAPPDQHCSDEVCVTCSDAAVAVTVTRLLPGGFAEVDTGRGGEVVSVALVPAGVGDTVLVHAGEAIAVVAR